MFKKLHLVRFKNFRDAELSIGPLTLLVGENATGKSNIRDAFRFLHGISRGYRLAEILGEKWGDEGVLQWRGIRGGTREAAFGQADSFVLEVVFDVDVPLSDDPGMTQQREATYRIKIEVGDRVKGPRVLAERLIIQGRRDPVFEAQARPDSADQPDAGFLAVRSAHTRSRVSAGAMFFVPDAQPALSLISERPELERQTRLDADLARHVLRSMRFFDPDPDALRRPSLPGQTVLGDRGENLASVLYAICQKPDLEDALSDWIRALTPMEAVALEFPSVDLAGRVQVMLVEQSGQKVSAESASDGTLRLLGMLAAILGPEHAGFYFFEEIENGIHPTRLHLLLNLIEDQAAKKGIQVVTTTHSPQLVGLVSPTTLENVALTYRLEGQPDARIKRILDLPHAREIIANHDLVDLLASSWMEDSVAFLEAPEAIAQ